MTALIPSAISPLDPERSPPEGISFNHEAGVLSYNVDGTGASIALTPADALLLGEWMLRYARRSIPPAPAGSN